MKYYCGPSWFPGLIIRYLSKDYGTNLACKIHDKDYIKQEFNKACIDKMFRVNLVNAGASKLKVNLFYYSVCLIGWVSWYYIKIKKGK